MSKKTPSSSSSTKKKLTQDQRTILDEVAHIPDRDQLFDTGGKTLPPDPEALYDDSWDNDPNQRVNNDRSAGRNLVNALADPSPMRRPAGPEIRAADTPTPVERGGGDDRLSMLSDKRIHELSEAMAIPGRFAMNRFQLIEALRSVNAPHSI